MIFWLIGLLAITLICAIIVFAVARIDRTNYDVDNPTPWPTGA